MKRNPRLFFGLRSEILSHFYSGPYSAKDIAESEDSLRHHLFVCVCWFCIHTRFIVTRSIGSNPRRLVRNLWLSLSYFLRCRAQI